MIDSRFFSDGSGGISVTQQFASSLRAGRLSTSLDASLLVVPYDGTAPKVRAVDAIRSVLPAGMKRWWWMARESLHNAPDEGLGPARSIDGAIADAESRGEPKQLGSVEAANVSSTTTDDGFRRPSQHPYNDPVPSTLECAGSVRYPGQSVAFRRRRGQRYLQSARYEGFIGLSLVKTASKPARRSG